MTALGILNFKQLIFCMCASFDALLSQLTQQGAGAGGVSLGGVRGIPFERTQRT